MAWMGLSVTHLYQARQFGITHVARTPILVQKGPAILKKLKISLICTRDSMQKILSMTLHTLL